jgi:transposase
LEQKVPTESADNHRASDVARRALRPDRDRGRSSRTEAVTPSQASQGNRKVQIPPHAIAYKLRIRIERVFNRLKHFRHIATRYDRRAIYFLLPSISPAP